MSEALLLIYRIRQKLAEIKLTLDQGGDLCCLIEHVRQDCRLLRECYRESDQKYARFIVGVIFDAFTHTPIEDLSSEGLSIPDDALAGLLN